MNLWDYKTNVLIGVVKSLDPNVFNWFDRKVMMQFRYFCRYFENDEMIFGESEMAV